MGFLAAAETHGMPGHPCNVPMRIGGSGQQDFVGSQQILGVCHVALLNYCLAVLLSCCLAVLLSLKTLAAWIGNTGNSMWWAARSSHTSRVWMCPLNIHIQSLVDETKRRSLLYKLLKTLFFRVFCVFSFFVFFAFSECLPKDRLIVSSSLLLSLDVM